MGVMSNLDLSRQEIGLVQATTSVVWPVCDHPDCCERVVLCEGCGSEGRLYTNDGGPYDTDGGPCPYCDGTGGEIIRTYPITLEDLEAIAEEMDQ